MTASAVTGTGPRRPRELLAAPGRTGRARTDPFPYIAWRRWLLRLVLALPYLLIGIVGASTGSTLAESTPNIDQLAGVAGIDWSSNDISWIGRSHPPLGTALVSVIPGGTLGLAIVASLAAGVFLQKMIEAMHQRRFHPVKTTMFALALGANPLFAYTVTQNMEGFLGVALFGLGAADMIRFIAGRDTQAGFRAGLLFMAAALMQASGLLYVTVAALSAPLITLARRHERGARVANILVIFFPTLAIFACLEFLRIVFLHSSAPLIASRLSYTPERWAILPHLVTTVDGLLILAPLVSGWALALLVRRPGAILISTMLFASLIVGYVVGLIPANAGGNVYLTMIVMGVAILPAASTTRASVLIIAVAALQVAIAWAAAFNRPVVNDWMHALLTAAGLTS